MGIEKDSKGFKEMLGNWSHFKNILENLEGFEWSKKYVGNWSNLKCRVEIIEGSWIECKGISRNWSIFN